MEIRKWSIYDMKMVNVTHKKWIIKPAFIIIKSIAINKNLINK